MSLPFPQEPSLTRRARPLGTTRARQIPQQLTSGRTTLQAARAYAELWHLALRAWKVEHPEPRVPVLRYGPGGSFDVSTLGEWAPDLPTVIRTPSGEVSESEVSQIINGMLASTMPEAETVGGFLERYRRGLQTPARLTDERGGWTYPRQRSVAYAIACLTFATRLGDRHPDLPRYLDACRAALKQQECCETP